MEKKDQRKRAVVVVPEVKLSFPLAVLPPAYIVPRLSYTPRKPSPQKTIDIRRSTPVFSPRKTITFIPSPTLPPVVTPRGLPSRFLTTPRYDKSDISIPDMILYSSPLPICSPRYDESAKKNSSICEQIKSLTSAIKPSPLRREIERGITGIVSHETFERMLEVYESHQMYYERKFEEGCPSVIASLNELEMWFSSIAEPQPVYSGRYYEEDMNSWRERENERKTYGISAYCNIDIKHHILPLSARDIR